MTTTKWTDKSVHRVSFPEGPLTKRNSGTLGLSGELEVELDWNHLNLGSQNVARNQ